MANPIVTSLPEYVEQQRLPLISKSMLGSKTAGYLTLQTDVKGETALNLIDTEVVLQDGSDCGFNAQGTTTLSQRTIKPVALKVNMNYCEKKLLKTWANYKVRVSAVDNALPFEEEFTNGVVEGVNASVEYLIWRGDTDNGAEFDGFMKILDNAEGVVTTDLDGVTSAYEAIKKVYLAIPRTVAKKSDMTIFVGEDLFDMYIQELIEANLYHYNATDTEGVHTLAGTSCKVVAVSGLNGFDNEYPIIAGRLSNMFIGVDAVNDEEKFDLWYSKDDRLFKLAIEFIMGVQVAYPDEITYASMAKA